MTYDQNGVQQRPVECFSSFQQFCCARNKHICACLRFLWLVGQQRQPLARKSQQAQQLRRLRAASVVNEV